jgi:MarR family 2-MHQ and catechol resistance regulon transcriptional repressor
MEKDKEYSPNAKGVHAWLVLWKTYHTVEAHAVRSIESLSICPSDFGVLEVLLHKGPMPINTIGKKVLLTSGSITTLVDRLEKRGFVERFDDISDRRIRLVRLTQTGRTVITEAFARHQEHLDQAVSDLSQGELSTLIELLKKLGHGAEARLKP